MAGSTKGHDSTSHVTADDTTAEEDAPVEDNEFELTADMKLQKQEEKDEVFIGKMTPSVAQCLDGTGSNLGARDMLLRHLALDECMIIYHLPQASHHKVQAVLVWRDNSYSHHDYYTLGDAIEAREANKKFAKKKDDGKAKKAKRKGIVMELAICDLDAGTFNKLCENYLKALHSRPAPQRITLMTDALRALSCALSMNELLQILPETIRSFVICCPPKMRVIPWHLLLIEIPAEVTISPDVDANGNEINSGNGTAFDNDKYRSKKFKQKEVRNRK